MKLIKQTFYLPGYVLSLLVLLNNVAVADEITPPDVLLKQTSDEIIEILKAKSDQLKDDPALVYDLVNEYILPHLDEVTIAKLALGKNWRKASREQKIEFIDEFKMLLIRTYGKSLSEFSDQTIRYFPVHINDGTDKVVVRSEVLQRGGPPIPVSYRMRKKDNGWKVYDLSIDGVSLVTSYRGTFAQEIRKGGMDGLLKMLKDKNTVVSSS